MKTRIALLSLFSTFVVAGTASAQSKFTKLGEEPAIRHKVELRDNRWEIVPEGAGSLNSPLRQHVMGGLRFRYHLSDAFAVGITGFGGITFPTKNFTGIIQVQDRDADGNADLPNGESDLKANNDNADFDPLRRVRAVKFGGSVDGELTPIYGKLGIFGKYFVRYDLSLVLGMGVVQTAGILAEVDDAGGAGVDARFIPSPHVGVGSRLFVNDFIALNLEFRDTLVLDNFDGGLINDVPATTLNNFVTGTLGASIFFPTTAKISK
jgi:outer membrane beta-barrel protein